jgi:hypothetical protein
MFVEKTIAELEAMTAEQLQAYKTEEKASNEAQTKAVIDAEVKAQIEQAKKTIKAELTGEIENQITDKMTIQSNESTKTELGKAFVENAENFDEKNKQHGFSQTIKAPALMTTANVVPNVTGGYSALLGNYIDTELGSTPKPDLCILPLVTIKTQPGTEVIYHTSRYNEEGDAAFIAEGGLKPLADAEWKTDSTTAKEVAVRWKFTKRLMNHAPSVVNDFMEHANELMEQKMDDGALEGDGTGSNLLGITATGVASAFVVPTQLAEYYTEANIYDVINAVATQVRLANFRGQLTVVLNTVWEAVMKGIKTTDGDYIVPPFVSPDGTMVGSIQVKFSNKIADTHILLGDLKKYNVVICDELTYDEGYENDDFSKNLVSKKLEAFLGSYIKRGDAGSIVYDAIAGILTDIEFVAP